MKDEILNSSVIESLLEKWRRRKWLLMCSFILLFSAMMSFVMALPSLYTSSTSLLFGQDGISESLVRESTNNELELRLGVVTQEVLSRKQLHELIEVFDLYAEMRISAPPESVIIRFRQDINIEQKAVTQPQWGQNTSYSITISYQGWDPELVADVANELANRFRSENERVRTGQALRTTEFIKAQMEESRARFTVEENRINEFKNSHMGELPEQQAMNLATLERLNSELRLKGEKEVQLLARRNDLLFGINANGQGSALAGLTGVLRLERLERDLTELKLGHTVNHPTVIRMEQEISQLKQDLANKPPVVPGDEPKSRLQNPEEIDQELAIIKQEEQDTKRLIAELVSRIDDMPLIDQQLRHLAYEYDTAREGYMSLQKRYQDARLAESLELQQSQQIKIVEVAIPPDFPTAPNQRSLMFLAFFMAIGLAGSAGLVTEHFDTSFHTNSALNRFTSIPVLGVIADIKTDADKWRLTLKTILVAVLLVVGISVLVINSRAVGSKADQIVWMLAK